MRLQISMISLLALCFNPRICKRCDVFSGIGAKKRQVSIHASVKDATPEHLPKNEHGYVSIHASVKDATKRITTTPLSPVFQSTHL